MTPDDLKNMTVGPVNQRVKAIKNCAGDYEIAHSLEDYLFQDVLAAIAAGNPNAQKLAAAALKPAKLAFERYAA